MATASMVLGIISVCLVLPMSIFLFPFGFASMSLAVMGLIFGIVSLKSEGSSNKAIAGIVTSAIAIFIELGSIILFSILLF